MNRKFTFGLLPDPPDPRDLLMRRVIRVGEIPPRMDLRNCLMPVRDQGDEGTCVAFACAGMKEHQEIKDVGQREFLSPRYLYHWAKQSDPYPGQEGTTIRSAMAVLHTQGICTEDKWPYIPGRPGTAKAGADQEAETFRIESYARLTTTLDIEKTVVTVGPIVMGLDIHPEFMTTGEDGRIPKPPRRYKTLGCHAVLLCGYDRNEEIFILRNSWGECWGQQGYGYATYYHINRCLVDAWSSVDIITGGTNQ